MKLDLYFTPHVKANSKRIKDLNLRPRTTILPGGNKEENLHDVDHGNDFSDMTPKAHLDKWNHIKLTKALLHCKGDNE